jgi:hypothetical protein
VPVQAMAIANTVNLQAERQFCVNDNCVLVNFGLLSITAGFCLKIAREVGFDGLQLRILFLKVHRNCICL